MGPEGSTTNIVKICCSFMRWLKQSICMWDIWLWWYQNWHSSPLAMQGKGRTSGNKRVVGWIMSVKYSHKANTETHPREPEHQENTFWSWLNLGKQNNAKALTLYPGHVRMHQHALGVFVSLWSSLTCPEFKILSIILLYHVFNKVYIQIYVVDPDLPP